MAGATVCWGSSATLARYLFRDLGVPPLQAVEMRLLVAALLLAPLLAWKRPHTLRVSRRDWGYFLALGLFGMAAVQGTYYYAIATLGVGLAILLQYLAPTLIVLLDVVRGIRVGVATLLGVVGALIGIGLLVGDLGTAQLQARPLDWIIGLGSAFAFATQILLSKRGLSRYAPETVLLYTFVVAGIFWALVAPPWQIVQAGYGPVVWISFAALGIFNTLVPFAMFYAGLRHLTAVQASIMATLEPVIAVGMASLFLREGLSPWQWVGALLVLIASILSTRRTPETLPAQAERG